MVAIGTDALAQRQPAEPPDSGDQLGSRDSEYGLSPRQPGSDDVAVVPRADPGPNVTTTPRYRFATARSGDSISKLLGDSDRGAVGRFLPLNGMDGRNSTLQIGHSYAVPTRFDDATPDEVAAGRLLLQSDNAKQTALRPPAANDGAIDHLASLFNTGFNPSSAGYVPPGTPSRQFHATPTYNWWDRSKLAKGVA